VALARRAAWRIVTRVIAGSLMLGVWFAGVLPGPVPAPMAGMDQSSAPAAHGAMARPQSRDTLSCDRPERAEPCARCDAGGCLTMQRCSTIGCVVLYRAPAAGVRSRPTHTGSAFATVVLWRTRSLAPPTPPPLAIRDQRA
jgi:hypothetical protein